MIVRSNHRNQPRPCRKPKNEAEAECHDWITEGGYAPVRRGYADYQVWDQDGNLLGLVEVKTKEHHALKESQRRLLIELSHFGVPTFAWSPNGGFEPIGETKPANPFAYDPQ